MTIVQFFRVTELRTKLVSLATLACAFAFVLSGMGGGAVDWPLAALLVAAVLAVDMGTTAFNSFFDYWRGEDNKESNREKEKSLVHEDVPPLAALFVGIGLYAIAIVLGVSIAVRSGVWVIAAGSLSLVAGFAYSGGPLPLSRTPFGDLCAGGFLGWGLFAIAARILGTGGTLAGGRIAGVLLCGLPLLFSVAAILSVNNACDFDNDVAAGRATLAIKFGNGRAAWPFYAFEALAWISAAALAAFAVLPPYSPFFLIPGAIGALAISFGMARKGFFHECKGPRMRAVLALHLLVSSCLSLSFLSALF